MLTAECYGASLVFKILQDSQITANPLRRLNLERFLLSITLEIKRQMKYHTFLPVLQNQAKKEELRFAVQKEAQAG